MAAISVGMYFEITLMMWFGWVVSEVVSRKYFRGDFAVALFANN